MKKATTAARGRWLRQPSTSVVPVASCQRATPSVIANLTRTPAASAQIERQAVLGAGDRRRHHVAGADAGGGEDEARAEVAEPGSDSSWHVGQSEKKDRL